MADAAGVDYDPRRVVHLVDNDGWYLCPFGFVGIEFGIRATWLVPLATCPGCLSKVSTRWAVGP